MLRKFLIFSFFIVGCTRPINNEVVVSEESVLLLSALINSEAGNSEDDMYLVGSTVLNRIDHANFPGNLNLVIFQSGQYNGTENRMFVPSDVTNKVAKDLLQGCGRDYDVLFFIQANKKFSFKNIEEVKKTKYHRFFKLS